MLYEIWSEGYSCSGMEGRSAPVHKLGEMEADSFIEAVQLWYDKEPEVEKRYGTLRISDNGEFARIWGCKLFDNEIEAGMSFG